MARAGKRLYPIFPFRVLSFRIFSSFFHAQQISDGARGKEKYTRVIPGTRSCWPASNPRRCSAHILNWSGPCFRGISHFPCSPPSSPEKGRSFDSRLLLHKHCQKSWNIYLCMFIGGKKSRERPSISFISAIFKSFEIVKIIFIHEVVSG